MSLFTEGFQAETPYWWSDVAWPDMSAPPPDDVDMLVIGAGYTGLSAAIAAADTGISVAVVDAGQPGQGASTRNGGMFGAHPRLTWSALQDRYGSTVADGVVGEALPAQTFVEDLIAREGIECALDRTGRIQLAWSTAHFEAQKALAQVTRDKGGVDCRIVERADLSNHIATDRYVGGLYFPHHCAIHPAKFHAGLLHACLRRGVTVSANMPATAAIQQPVGFAVPTPVGAIRARHVVLATNGYTSRGFDWQARRVFPVPSYLIATEELDPQRLAALAPGGRMMVETRAKHSYYRLSPDGTRILFGGRSRLTPISPERAAHHLYDTMTDIWPSLKGVRLSHAWTGNTGYTFAHTPHVGAHEGVFYAMGFSGSGTVMAPYLGAKAAWMALGDPRGETAFASTALASKWFYRGGAPWFMHMVDAWYRNVTDRREARVAGR